MRSRVPALDGGAKKYSRTYVREERRRINQKELRLFRNWPGGRAGWERERERERGGCMGGSACCAASAMDGRDLTNARGKKRAVDGATAAQTLGQCNKPIERPITCVSALYDARQAS
jgi:hypothetical protein